MRPGERGICGLATSPIGLGTWALGGAEQTHGWGSQSRHESVATLERAARAGIDWIDTAPVYGLGAVESLIGEVLGSLPVEQRPRVFTKCSLRWDATGALVHSLRRNAIAGDVDASLRRLQVERLDLCQIHWPAFGDGDEADCLEEAMDALTRLQEAGKLRAIGVSNFDADQIRRARRVAPISCLQAPYSLLRREIEAEILPFCRREGIAVLAYSPLQSGLLSGAMTRERIAALPATDWRGTKSPEFQEPRLSIALDRVERLRAIARERGATPAQIAIAWVLTSPGITGAVVGARRPEQLDEVLPAAKIELTRDEWRWLAWAPEPPAL